MSIEFLCHACGHTIRVSEEKSGKHGLCPHCKAKVEVPIRSGGEGAPGEAGDLASRPPPIPEALPPALPSFAWHVSVEGRSEGPYPHERVREMIREGRLSPTSLVWRQGLADWIPLREAPELSQGQGGSGRGKERLRRGRDLGKQIVSNPILTLTARDPEEAFKKAGEPGTNARQLALALLGTSLLLGILVWLPAVVKGEQTLLSGLVGGGGGGFNQGYEQQFRSMFGSPSPRWAGPKAPSAVGVFLKQATPMYLVLYLALFGIGFGVTSGCLAIMGKGPRVAYRAIVIMGLSSLPTVAACAAVFLLGWVHVIFYALLGCGVLVSILFYYQGLRTLGTLPSGKAAYSVCALAVISMIAAPIITALFLTSW